MLRFHLFISGRVQMVAFRYSARRKAQQLNVRGWVKNLPDGRVEAVVEGEDNSVKEMIEWCKKGSMFARVDNVEVKAEKSLQEFNDFDILF